MKKKYQNVTECIAKVADEFGATIVLIHSGGDYHGVTMYLLRSAEDKYGIIWYNFGSCPNCDAFQCYYEKCYYEKALDLLYDPEEKQDEIWKPFEDGFRIELKQMEWLERRLFQCNYHMEFAKAEQEFQEKCELYFRSINGQ